MFKHNKLQLKSLNTPLNRTLKRIEALYFKFEVNLTLIQWARRTLDCFMATEVGILLFVMIRFRATIFQSPPINLATTFPNSGYRRGLRSDVFFSAYWFHIRIDSKVSLTFWWCFWWFTLFSQVFISKKYSEFERVNALTSTTFGTSASGGLENFEIFVECSFGIEILTNFVSGFKDVNTQEIVDDVKVISKKYLKFFFILFLFKGSFGFLGGVLC